MKRLKKSLTLFLMMTVLLLLPVLQIQAADKTPGKVKKLTATAVSETSIRLNWSKVSDVTGYYVYRINEKGKLKKVATTSKTNCTFSKLPVNTEYTYQVFAYKKTKKNTYESEKGSPTATVSTYIKTPKKPENLRVSLYGDKTATLKWSSGESANGYYVYLYNEKKDTYKLKTTTRSKTYTLKGLKDGEEYKVRIQSFRKVGDVIKTGGKQDLTVVGREFSNTVKSVHGRYWGAYLKADTTGIVVSTGKKRVIKKGTNVTAKSKSTGTVTVILSNGTEVKLSGKRLKYGNLKVTTKDYSTATMEAFVNAKGYESKTSYLIWVNQYTTTMNVFKKTNGKWKLARKSPCIVGRYGNSPVGVYEIEKQDWYCGGPALYWTWNERLQHGNSFHKYVDWHTRGAYSGGCIRLADADLNYIVKYCKVGTTVVSY